MREAALSLKNHLLNGPYEKIDSLLILLQMEQKEVFPILLRDTCLLPNGTVEIPSFYRDQIGQLTSYSEYSFWKTLSLMTEKPLWCYGVEMIRFNSLPQSEAFKLPEGVKACPSLRGISFAGCDLEEIPDSLFDLRRLRYLDISSNHLKSLPSGIGRLGQLVYFNAADNELESLPGQFGHLRKLKHLDLSGNCLSCIGFSLESLSRLNGLDLSGNCLDHVPKGLEMLNQLEKVDLSFNDLSAEEEAAWESRHFSRIKNYQWPLSF